MRYSQNWLEKATDQHIVRLGKKELTKARFPANIRNVHAYIRGYAS